MAALRNISPRLEPNLHVWNCTRGTRGLNRTFMGSFIHHDRIAEKLEIARTMGLVKRYSVLPTGPEGRAEASVMVWGAAAAADSALKSYLFDLLHGLVAVDQILVLPPSQAEETAAAMPGEEALPDSVPVAA